MNVNVAPSVAIDAHQGIQASDRPAHASVDAPSQAGAQPDGDQGEPGGQRKQRTPGHACTHGATACQHGAKAHEHGAGQIVPQFVFGFEALKLEVATHQGTEQ